MSWIESNKPSLNANHNEATCRGQKAIPGSKGVWERCSWWKMPKANSSGQRQRGEEAGLGEMVVKIVNMWKVGIPLTPEEQKLSLDLLWRPLQHQAKCCTPNGKTVEQALALEQTDLDQLLLWRCDLEQVESPCWVSVVVSLKWRWPHRSYKVIMGLEIIWAWMDIIIISWLRSDWQVIFPYYISQLHRNKWPVF